MRRSRTWLSCAVALLACSLAAGTAGAGQLTPWMIHGKTAEHSRRQHRDERQPAGSSAPRVPIAGPTSWSDTLDDAAGLTWLERTQLQPGSVSLSRTESVGEDVRSIVSLAEGPDGVLYMGTTEARLWSYDPATGVTLDLGTPVPAECFN